MKGGMNLNNSLKKYLHELRMEKKQKRRLASFITAMSVFVSTGVFWQLRGIGTAMTDNTLNNESDTAAALSAHDTSLCETDKVWESTLPELTDELAENAALIAASQLGYTENTQNYIVGEDGCTHKNYSRYGAWFGNPYGDWNTMFTCFCLYYAGVKETDIPFSSGCWAWSMKLSEKGVLSPFNKGSPKRGDVLLFDTDLDGKADRSGIISEISSDTEETCIITIEGQVGGTVAECSCSPDDEHIIGYVPVETPEKENVSLIEYSAESESGIKVFASAEQGIFPDGTEMLASDVSDDAILEKAAGALGTGADDIEAAAVDISFMSPDGIELEPADSSAVHVEIILPEEQKLSGEEFSLLHFDDSGGAEIVKNAEVSDSSAVFEAESFSIYVVTAVEEKEKDRVNEYLAGIGLPAPNEAGYISNTEQSPYYLRVGDTLELAGYSLSDNYFFYDSQSSTEYESILKGGEYSKKEQITSYDGNTYNKKVRTYTALKAGLVVIRFDTDGRTINGNKNYNIKNFYVRVVNDEKIVQFNANTWENQNNPIDIKVGDKITLIGSSSVPDANFYFPNNVGISNGSGWSPHSDILSDFELIGSGANASSSFIATGLKENSNNIQSVCLNIAPGEYKSIYFRVNNGEMLDHSDIEITDGGTYVTTHELIKPDGSKEITKVTYEARVRGVNTCYLFDSNNNRIKNMLGDDIEYVTADYQDNGEYGTPQYEYTSKYQCMGRPSKEFYYYDVDHAQFDVKLHLIPQSVTKYTLNTDGSISPMSSSITDYNEIMLNSVIFNLDKRSVIDAYNKCPNHTGLDFTIKADLNEVLKDSVPIYKLPSTGGGGTAPYMAAGSCIIIFSFAALLLRKRKEDK